MPDRTRVEHEIATTGVMRGVEQIDSFAARPVAPAEPEPYVREPLFSKKVLFGWAFATLAVWFALSFVVPEIIETIRTEIASRVEPAGRGPAGERIYRTRRGVVKITRTDKGITIEQVDAADAPAAATVTVPVVPPAEPAPPAGAAPAPPQPTGKK